VLGTVVLLRVEDWLREELQSAPEGSVGDSQIRQQLRVRVDEFISQLATVSHGGSQVWFLACPSTGWISEHYKLTTLLKTYTNLIATRVRNLSQVTSLSWPGVLSPLQTDDHCADREEHVPFSEAGFEQLGQLLGGQIIRTLARKDTGVCSTSGGSTALAAYLAGLNLKVQIASALPQDRPDIERLIRATASFSLTGERPTMTEEEISALLAGNLCLLVSVSDRVSNYETSGLVLLRLSEGDMVISAMALSCTILGKQVEYAVLSALAQLAAGSHLSRLIFEYVPTSHNGSILSFLEAMTDRESDTRYVLPADLVEARIKGVAVNPGAWTLTQTELLDAGLLVR
jgi:hypothetical protein